MNVNINVNANLRNSSPYVSRSSNGGASSTSATSINRTSTPPLVASVEDRSELGTLASVANHLSEIQGENNTPNDKKKIIRKIIKKRS